MTFDNLITKNDYYVNQGLTFIFNYISSILLFYKSQNFRTNRKSKIYLIVLGLLSSVLIVFVKSYNETLVQFLSVLLISVSLSLSLKSRGKLTCLIGIALISISISHVIRLISALIITSLLWMIGFFPQNIIICSMHGVAQILLSVLLMKVKRIKKGISFIENEENLGLGIALSGIVLVLINVNGTRIQDEDVMFVVIIVGIIIVGFGLYLWIRRSITAHYRERLQLKSEEHYQTMLEECEKEIEKLNETNAFLAKIVHRDNHLMSSLNTSIDAYFSNDDKERNDSLLREIQTLAKERGELIEKEQIASKLLPTTGNLLIDSAINDLYIKAASRGINFDLTVSETVDEIIGKYITQTDLQTLLCDHIKDAITAVEAKGADNGKIMVNLSMKQDCYDITVFDSGVDFDAKTLSKLGLERATTHGDSGGSGIGFMTTFETLKRAYASLIITEFEHKTPFSKSVAFRFDGENTFIIQSYRNEELKDKIQREDIILNPK